MDAAAALADAIKSTEGMLFRYLEGFDDGNAVAQTPTLPNHAAWTLGHLALTMHRAAERIADDRFGLDWDPEPYALGSTPTPDRDDYPPLAELSARYRQSMDLLVDAVQDAGETRLARPVTWGRSETTARDLAIRMVVHNGIHIGQLVDLRRALHMSPVIR